MKEQAAGRTRSTQTAASLVGAVHVDGDATRIVLAEPGDRSGRIRLVHVAEAPKSELGALVEEATRIARSMSRGGSIEWVTTLAGDLALHDVLSVPPQFRSFDDAVRLDAVLSGSNWGNSDAVAAAGYLVGHEFRGDQCLLAIARTDDVSAHSEGGAPGAIVTTDASALLSLVDRVRPDCLSPAAGSTLVLSCGTSSVTSCAVEDGRIRLLHQVSLLDRLRDTVSRPDRVAAASPDELEYEFAGSYSVPPDVRRNAPLAEIRAAEVESAAYQTALLRIVDEVLGLATEADPGASFSPDTILITGAAAYAHAISAYLRMCFGSSVTVDELDAALAVRIDDPDLARDVAAQQSQFAGALAAVAVAVRRPRIVLQPAADAVALASTSSRASRRASWPGRSVSPGLVIVLAAIVILGAGVSGGRWALVTRRHTELAAQIASESAKRAELESVAAEWRAAEARLAHTRALLATLKDRRAQQMTPPRLLAAIRAVLPTETRLTEIAFSAGVLRISGYCETRDVGPSIALAMEQDKVAFADVTPQTGTAVLRLPDADSGVEVDTTVRTFSITARYMGGAAK